MKSSSKQDEMGSSMVGDRIIHLQPNDDFAAARAALDASGGQRVAFVVPPGCTVVRSLVHLKALHRRAETLGKKICLITSDLDVRMLCREVPIRTFGSVAACKRKGWISREAIVETQPFIPEHEGAIVPPPPRQPAAKRRSIWSSLFGRPRQRINWLRQMVLLMSIVALGILLVMGVIFTYPGAQVQLVPDAQPVEFETVVTADPSVEMIDVRGNVVPARVVQVDLERSHDLEVSSTRDAPSDRAEGTVVFINRSDQAVEVPISTTVSTSSGTPIRFLTVESTTVPPGPGATAPTRVMAFDPGPVGNVAPFLINRVDDPGLALQLRVINEQPTSGGTVRQAGVVTQSDRDRLQALLTQRIQQEGYAMIVEGLSEQEFVPPESVEVIILSLMFDTFVGDVTDSVGLQMRAVVRGTAIPTFSLNQLVPRKLMEMTPPGYELVPEGLTTEVVEVVNVEERIVTLGVRGSGMAVARLDPAAVASQIAWLSTDEARSLIEASYPLAASPLITIEPDWLGRLPYFPFRIDVTVVEPEAVRVAGVGDHR